MYQVTNGQVVYRMVPAENVEFYHSDLCKSKSCEQRPFPTDEINEEKIKMLHGEALHGVLFPVTKNTQEMARSLILSENLFDFSLGGYLFALYLASTL